MLSVICKSLPFLCPLLHTYLILENCKLLPFFFFFVIIFSNFLLESEQSTNFMQISSHFLLFLFFFRSLYLTQLYTIQAALFFLKWALKSGLQRYLTNLFKLLFRHQGKLQKSHPLTFQLSYAKYQHLLSDGRMGSFTKAHH